MKHPQPPGWQLRQSLKSLCILSKDQRKHSWIMKAVFLSYEAYYKNRGKSWIHLVLGCFTRMPCPPLMETMQEATFVSWPLPSNTVLVSKSLWVLETTRLCWGLYDSNYIICPICYCFIHVRIICFGFLCNVWGVVYSPWETCCTVCALDRLFIKCPVFCQVDFPTMMHR